jgi:hypothetical protein
MAEEPGAKRQKPIWTAGQKVKYYSKTYDEFVDSEVRAALREFVLARARVQRRAVPAGRRCE